MTLWGDVGGETGACSSTACLPMVAHTSLLVPPEGQVIVRRGRTQNISNSQVGAKYSSGILAEIATQNSASRLSNNCGSADRNFE